jgi:hypothetical protein
VRLVDKVRAIEDRLGRRTAYDDIDPIAKKLMQDMDFLREIQQFADKYPGKTTDELLELLKTEPIGGFF